MYIIKGYLESVWMAKEYVDRQFLINVGDNIRQILKEKKITHEVFYFDTGIHPDRLLSGKSNITLSTLKRVSDYLEIPVKELV